MKIVLKQSDFSDPAILVQRNQQLKLESKLHRGTMTLDLQS